MCRRCDTISTAVPQNQLDPTVRRAITVVIAVSQMLDVVARNALLVTDISYLDCPTGYHGSKVTPHRTRRKHGMGCGCIHAMERPKRG